MQKDSKLSLAPAQDNGGSETSHGRRGPRHRHWGTTGKVDPVCRDAGLQLGLSSKAAEHALAETQRRAIAFLEAFRRHHADLRHERWWRPIARAAAVEPTAPYSPAIEVTAQAADGAEENAQLSYQLHECRETAEARVRALDREITEKVILRNALLDKWNLR